MSEVRRMILRHRLTTVSIYVLRIEETVVNLQLNNIFSFTFKTALGCTNYMKEPSWDLHEASSQQQKYFTSADSLVEARCFIISLKATLYPYFWWIVKELKEIFELEKF